MLLRKAHQAGGSESFKTVGKRPPSFGCTQMRRTSVAPSHPAFATRAHDGERFLLFGHGPLCSDFSVQAIRQVRGGCMKPVGIEPTTSAV